MHTNKMHKSCNNIHWKHWLWDNETPSATWGNTLKFRDFKIHDPSTHTHKHTHHSLYCQLVLQ